MEAAYGRCGAHHGTERCRCGGNSLADIISLVPYDFRGLRKSRTVVSIANIAVGIGAGDVRLDSTYFLRLWRRPGVDVTGGKRRQQKTSCGSGPLLLKSAAVVGWLVVGLLLLSSPPQSLDLRVRAFTTSHVARPTLLDPDPLAGVHPLRSQWTESATTELVSVNAAAANFAAALAAPKSIQVAAVTVLASTTAPPTQSLRQLQEREPNLRSAITGQEGFFGLPANDSNGEASGGGVVTILATSSTEVGNRFVGPQQGRTTTSDNETTDPGELGHSNNRSSGTNGEVANGRVGADPNNPLSSSSVIGDAVPTDAGGRSSKGTSEATVESNDDLAAKTNAAVAGDAHGTSGENHGPSKEVATVPEPSRGPSEADSASSEEHDLVTEEASLEASNQDSGAVDDDGLVLEVDLSENKELASSPLFQPSIQRQKPSEDGDTENGSIEAYIAFFLVSFVSAAILQSLIPKVSVYSVPVSIVWFLFGMSLSTAVYVVGRLSADPRREGETKYAFGSLAVGIGGVGSMNAEIVYLVFLPILLYEACLNLNWHKFKRFAYSGITLAVLGVGYQVAFVGMLTQMTLSKEVVGGPGSGRNSWSNSFLVASSLVSTDPVAVISVLNGLQAPEKLASMFEGESLINDGSSMLLFQFFKSLSRGDVESWSAIVGKIFLLLIVGPLWGCFAGMVTYWWLKRLRSQPDVQILALLGTAYSVYYYGEKFIHTSGPIAIVGFGLYFTAFGRIALDNHAQQQHHHSVKALASLANCSAFIVAGVVCMRMILEALSVEDGFSGVLVWNVPVLYLYLLAARTSMIVLFLPVLKKTGYGISWQEIILLIWGGLRGAIVLAMGLMIEQDHHILSLMRYQAVVYIAGNVFLILLVNGVTFELLFKLLNPYPPKPFRRVYLERVAKLIDYQYIQERRVLGGYWLFRGTSILAFADRAVPVLGWRRMNTRGRIDFKLPSLSAAFSDLLKCDIDEVLGSWSHPSSPDCYCKDGNNHVLRGLASCSAPASVDGTSGSNSMSLQLERETAQAPRELVAQTRSRAACELTRNTGPAASGDDGSIALASEGRKSSSTGNQVPGSLGVDAGGYWMSPTRRPSDPALNRAAHPSSDAAAVAASSQASTAETRAHAAAVALLGLRDAREAQNTFDAKYYLRLVEHVTEEVPDENDASRCSGGNPEWIPHICSRGQQLLLTNEGYSDTEMYRAFPSPSNVGAPTEYSSGPAADQLPDRVDTDITIVFPSTLPSESTQFTGHPRPIAGTHADSHGSASRRHVAPKPLVGTRPFDTSQPLLRRSNFGLALSKTTIGITSLPDAVVTSTGKGEEFGTEGGNGMLCIPTRGTPLPGRAATSSATVAAALPTARDTSSARDGIGGVSLIPAGAGEATNCLLSGAERDPDGITSTVVTGQCAIGNYGNGKSRPPSYDADSEVPGANSPNCALVGTSTPRLEPSRPCLLRHDPILRATPPLASGAAFGCRQSHRRTAAAEARTPYCGHEVPPVSPQAATRGPRIARRRLHYHSNLPLGQVCFGNSGHSRLRIISASGARMTRLRRPEWQTREIVAALGPPPPTSGDRRRTVNVNRCRPCSSSSSSGGRNVGWSRHCNAVGTPPQSCLYSSTQHSPDWRWPYHHRRGLGDGSVAIPTGHGASRNPATDQSTAERRSKSRRSVRVIGMRPDVDSNRSRSSQSSSHDVSGRSDDRNASVAHCTEPFEPDIGNDDRVDSSSKKRRSKVAVSTKGFINPRKSLTKIIDLDLEREADKIPAVGAQSCRCYCGGHITPSRKCRIPVSPAQCNGHEEYFCQAALLEPRSGEVSAQRQQPNEKHSVSTRLLGIGDSGTQIVDEHLRQLIHEGQEGGAAELETARTTRSGHSQPSPWRKLQDCVTHLHSEGELQISCLEGAQRKSCRSCSCKHHSGVSGTGIGVPYERHSVLNGNATTLCDADALVNGSTLLHQNCLLWTSSHCDGNCHPNDMLRSDPSTASIRSCEEYLEMPATPHHRNFVERSSPRPIARVKVLRKEREGELYIMVFNAIRHMYRRLYEQHFIGGAAFLSLGGVLNMSIDFAIGKLQRGPIKAWKEVLQELPHNCDEPSAAAAVAAVAETKGTKPDQLEELSGFEFEWRIMAYNLHCVRHSSVEGATSSSVFIWFYRHFPGSKVFKATLTYDLAMSDLQQITAFVDVHEELLWKGGQSLESLLGPKLLTSYKRQITEAKNLVRVLRYSFPETFTLVLAVHATTLLINLKHQLIEEQAQKGLILDEDSQSLLQLFQDQLHNLTSYRPSSSGNVALCWFLWLLGRHKDHFDVPTAVSSEMPARQADQQPVAYTAPATSATAACVATATACRNPCLPEEGSTPLTGLSGVDASSVRSGRQAPDGSPVEFPSSSGGILTGSSTGGSSDGSTGLLCVPRGYKPTQHQDRCSAAECVSHPPLAPSTPPESRTLDVASVVGSLRSKNNSFLDAAASLNRSSTRLQSRRSLRAVTPLYDDNIETILPTSR